MCFEEEISGLGGTQLSNALLHFGILSARSY